MKTTAFTLLIAVAFLPGQRCSTHLKDVFTSNDDDLARRQPRDNKQYRFGGEARARPSGRALKPEDVQDAANPQAAPVEKRCSRCDYNDHRYPYDYRSRYDDRRLRDRYDSPEDYRRYDDRYDRYYDRRPDYYYPDRAGYDRDRYVDRYRDERYPDRYSDRGGNRYYDGYNDRGLGYDNRGYDYRERYDRDGYRPWDETYRGTSGWDNNGRGYYFAGGRPETGYGGGGGAAGGNYASGWNYGNRDEYRDRDRGYGGYFRPSNQYYDGYRGTSYLYGRPSSTTTPRSDSNDDPGVTQNPQQDNSSG